MSFPEQSTTFASLDAWFKTPAGMSVLAAFTQELDPFIEQVFGERFLQLGHCGDTTLAQRFRYRQRFMVSPAPTIASNDVVALINHLPFHRNSVDCVFAPLTLNAFKNRIIPLDEIDRILKPMGYAIFMGINPLGLMGLASRLKLWSCFDTRSPILTSPYYLIKRLTARGYHQCQFSTFYYIPPVKSQACLDNLSFFNTMGSMLWPFPAGFYCLIVQKMESIAPTPIFNTARNLDLSMGTLAGAYQRGDHC